jgi:RecJ-like exonuclease
MVLSSGNIAQDLPLLAFAQTDDGKAIKVSARATRELVARGLDLATALTKAAQKVSGIGGGHAIAAGATIPKGSEEDFLNETEKIIKEQVSI